MERSKRELIYDRINTLALELYSADVMELKPYQKQKKESELVSILLSLINNPEIWWAGRKLNLHKAGYMVVAPNTDRENTEKEQYELKKDFSGREREENESYEEEQESVADDIEGEQELEIKGNGPFNEDTVTESQYYGIQVFNETFLTAREKYKTKEYMDENGKVQPFSKVFFGLWKHNLKLTTQIKSAENSTNRYIRYSTEKGQFYETNDELHKLRQMAAKKELEIVARSKNNINYSVPKRVTSLKDVKQQLEKLGFDTVEAERKAMSIWNTSPISSLEIQDREDDGNYINSTDQDMALKIIEQDTAQDNAEENIENHISRLLECCRLILNNNNETVTNIQKKYVRYYITRQVVISEMNEDDAEKFKEICDAELAVILKERAAGTVKFDETAANAAIAEYQEKQPESVRKQMSASQKLIFKYLRASIKE